VKSPEELQQFADKLTSSYSILSSLKKVGEVDTQSSVVDTMNRLQPYLRNRWRSKAMEQKRKEDFYPTFKQFVDFIIQVQRKQNIQCTARLNHQLSNPDYLPIVPIRRIHLQHHSLESLLMLLYFNTSIHLVSSAMKNTESFLDTTSLRPWSLKRDCLLSNLTIFVRTVFCPTTK